MANRYMLDTVIFNWIIDGKITIDDLPNDGDLLVTHIQRDELNAAPIGERREKLISTLNVVVDDYVLTESSVFGFSKFGEAKLSGSAGVGWGKIKRHLDSLTKRKSKKGRAISNTCDALIAEAASANNCILITTDEALWSVCSEFGISVRLMKIPA